MNVIIQTERLIGRTFTVEDGPLIYELNLDPEVTRYTLDPIRDQAHAQEVLETVILPQYALYNFGRWAIHTRPDMEFIGWCGLKMRPEKNEIDLGYRFKPSAWGKGYATEIASASLKYGFGELQLGRIVGRALPGNIASIRVLEKCGMVYTGQETIEGLLHECYEAINPSIHG